MTVLDVSALSPETIADAIDTLRHLKTTFDRGLRIDHIDMGHVERSLARVDIELSFGRVAERAPLLHAAE